MDALRPILLISFIYGYWVLTPLNIILAIVHKVKRGKFFPNAGMAVIFFVQLLFNLFVMFVFLDNTFLHIIPYYEVFSKSFVGYAMSATLLGILYLVFQCCFLFEKEVKPTS